MKFACSFLLAAALLAAPFAAGAESAVLLSSSWQSTLSAPRARSESTFLVTDGAGRLAAFTMESEDGVMTLTIRQDGAVVFRRSYPASDGAFSVARREENGLVYFLIDAGGKKLLASQDASGAWDVRPAKDAAPPEAAMPL